jgi:hypothetical protein
LFKSKKALVVGLVMGAVGAGCGAASAYYVLEATGTGTTTVNVAKPSTTTGQVDIVACGAGATTTSCPAIAPVAYAAATPEEIDFQVTNTTSSPVNLTTIAVSLTSISNGDGTTGIPACSPSWFTITQPATNVGLALQPNGTGVLNPGNGGAAFISMPSDTVDNQNNCEGATLNLSLAAS